MNRYLIISCLLLGLCCFRADGQSNNNITNYYSMPTGMKFSGLNYTLSWSTHPNNIYYKQEYVADGQKTEHYNDMLVIDFLITELTVKDVVGTQLKGLLERKQSDKICNYQVVKNQQTGEYILDFIVSEGSDDHIDIAEWNAYRYKSYTDKKGHKGVLLLGVSHRSYQDESNIFLKNLKKYRFDVINNLSVYAFPEININK